MIYFENNYLPLDPAIIGMINNNVNINCNIFFLTPELTIIMRSVTLFLLRFLIKNKCK